MVCTPKPTKEPFNKNQFAVAAAADTVPIVHVELHNGISAIVS